MTWQEKPGKTITPGRLLHAAIGAAVPLIAGRRGGYSAAAWGLVGSLSIGLGWEMATPALAPHFHWQFAYPDLIDFGAFVFGGLAGVGSYFATRRGKR